MSDLILVGVQKIMKKVAVKKSVITKRPLNVKEVQMISGGRGRGRNQSQVLSVSITARGRWGVN